MWLLFQCVVMIAVGWTGIYYEWTPNKVALGIVAVFAAWWATKIVSGDRRAIVATLCVCGCLLLLRLWNSG